MILVDTCIWSLAFRRRHRDRNPEEQRAFYEWRDLMIAGRAVIIGPIRQEVLSGIANRHQFDSLRHQLAGIEQLDLDDAIWETAAEFYNECRAHGVAADDIDLTICAAAHFHGAEIFTVDPDFERYCRHLPVRLHVIGSKNH